MNPSITVYEYDKSGLYTGETTAEPSPREEGVWLIPANAPRLEPPVTSEHECAVFRNGRWSVRYDFRGTTYWLPDGSEHTITETGMIVPENALTEPPSPSLESVRKKRLAELVPHSEPPSKQRTAPHRPASKSTPTKERPSTSPA